MYTEGLSYVYGEESRLYIKSKKNKGTEIQFSIPLKEGKQENRQGGIMRKAQNYQWKEMSLGTCYYPEHWDKKLWREDLERMLANGIHTIRIGEFAWNRWNPETEREFTFDFFDDFSGGCRPR